MNLKKSMIITVCSLIAVIILCVAVIAETFVGTDTGKQNKAPETVGAGVFYGEEHNFTESDITPPSVNPVVTENTDESDIRDIEFPIIRIQPD